MIVNVLFARPCAAVVLLLLQFFKKFPKQKTQHKVTHAIFSMFSMVIVINATINLCVHNNHGAGPEQEQQLCGSDKSRKLM